MEHDCSRYCLKRLLPLAILVIVAALVYVAYMLGKIHAVQATQCNQLVTRAIAQDMYNTDPIKYSWMDRDHDQQACEALPAFKQVK